MRRIGIYLGMILGFGVCALTLMILLRTPSHERMWSSDQAVLPTVVSEGESITISNIRNASYQSEDDYTIQYFTKTFSLTDITSIDYIVVPFDDLYAAHTMVSVGFSDGTYLGFSGEIRKEVGERFSIIRGLLREYEYMVVVADERDLLTLRAVWRGDRIYRYPLVLSAEDRAFFIQALLTRITTTAAVPEFYNTLTNNCTTLLFDPLAERAPGLSAFDHRVVVSEFSGDLLAEHGLLGAGVVSPLDHAAYRIDDKIRRYATSTDFSRLIRAR